MLSHWFGARDCRAERTYASQIAVPERIQTRYEIPGRYREAQSPRSRFILSTVTLVANLCAMSDMMRLSAVHHSPCFLETAPKDEALEDFQPPIQLTRMEEDGVVTVCRAWSGSLEMSRDEECA